LAAGGGRGLILTSLTESDALSELREAMNELTPGQPIDCLQRSLLYA
jgi:hypothetical protein